MTKQPLDKASAKQPKQESQDSITKIKAISLHQPYASLIAMGLKKFETRSWRTNYRGKLVICASLKNTKQQQFSYEDLASSFGLELTVPPWSSLPLGMAIAVCDLTDCIEMTDEFISEQSEQEQLCGHWETGCFAWKLENVQPLPQSLPIKGKQGLWNISLDEFERLCGDAPDDQIIIPDVLNGQALTETLELTHEEERDRLHLERKVERAFYEAGKALKEIRDRRLYRSTHQTFEEYCLERFGFTRRRPYFLIDAAAVVDNLEKCDPMDHKNWKLPTNERQVRPLIRLDPSEQVEAWSEAVNQAGGKVPPARIVQEVVQKMQQPTLVPNPWRVGEVAQIIVNGNPDLKGKGGCWCVITEINNFSCTVRLWDGVTQVKLENLKELPYQEAQAKELIAIGDRLSKIKLDEVEKPAWYFLAGLGKIERYYLTELEEELLTLIETKTK